MDKTKKTVEWGNYDTVMLNLPEELLAYHIYRRDQKRTKNSGQEEKIIKSYLYREKKREMEMGRCLKM